MTDRQTEVNALNMNIEVVDLKKLQNEQVGRYIDVGVAEPEQGRQDEVLPDCGQVRKYDGSEAIDENR